MPNIEVGQALGAPLEVRGEVLLSIPEDQWFERKDSRVSPLALANAEGGLANADGGVIVVGLSGGVVQGTDAVSEHRNGLMQAAIDFTEPAVRAHSTLVPCINQAGEGDRLLVIEVEPSESVHANQRDEVFIRVGDENRRLNFRQRQELVYDKGQALFEATIAAGATLADLDQDLLSSYAGALQHPDPERLLAARGLTNRDGDVTAAAVLLFGAAPQVHFPEAYVRILRYLGVERGAGRRQRLREDRRYEGPIPRILHEATEEIRALQPTRRALGGHGRFEAIGLIPEDAWLEALVNAVVHRSYSLAGDHIRVEVFDDRMEIESPGRFPGLVSPEEPLEATRFARNPRIARVCSDLHFGQELGEGIRRMFEEMRLAGLSDPLYHQTAGSVRLTLLTAPIDRELEARLPTGSREILSVLREAGPLSTGDLVEVTGMSRPSVIRRMNILRDTGLVGWSGKAAKDPRARWQLRP
ncbi:MAG: putative DNA binding domain-containing protein [Actinobacteria bacterium]|nr:putative DNA binding domain-containing protein [Actinomycetota bacterium]